MKNRAAKYIMPGNMAREVVVTAMGAVSPAGTGVEALWKSLAEGRDLIRPIRVFDADRYECRNAALVPDRDESGPRGFLDRALAEALRDSPFRKTRRTGLSLGTTLGGAAFIGPACDGTDPLRRTAADVPYHALTDACARELGVALPPATLSGACASSLIAIGLGFLWIRSGKADAVLAGGYDFFCEFVHSGFSSLKALTPGKVRPFDLNRNGIVLGEGAGLLLLEEETAAIEAGRRPLARITGFSCVSDGNHITGPHPNGEGLYRSILKASAMASACPGDFDFVLAHGTATVYNDRMESIALNRFFGAGVPPASSIKSMIGHTLGASGALETVASVMAIRDGIAPPTINFSDADPECVLDPVPNEPRRMSIGRVLKTSSGFGGQNCAIVIENPGPGPGFTSKNG